MGKKKVQPNYRRRTLRLPDLDHSALAVLMLRKTLRKDALQTTISIFWTFPIPGSGTFHAKLDFFNTHA